MRKYLIPLLLIGGALFRLALLPMAEMRIIWDMEAYVSAAVEIFHGRFASDCCNHGQGYPLLLAALFRLFGERNFDAVRLTQVLMDLATGVMVGVTAKKLFGGRVSVFALGLYMFNPFTSSYIGLILSETFLLLLMSIMGYFFVQDRLSTLPTYWLLFGFLLGFITITKVSLYYLMVPLVVLAVWRMPAKIYRLQYLLVVTFGYMLAVSYAIIANFAVFHVVSIVPPYINREGFLYRSFYLGRHPELLEELDHPGFSKESVALTHEFYEIVNTDPSKLTSYQDKYQTLFWDKMRKDWPLFVKNTLRNAIFLWDKRFLGYYTDPWYPYDRTAIRLINGAFLLFHAVGMGSVLLRDSRKPGQLSFALLSLLFIVYISFVMGSISNETRWSLPYYPLMIVWTAYGLFNMRSWAKRVV